MARLRIINLTYINDVGGWVVWIIFITVTYWGFFFMCICGLCGGIGGARATTLTWRSGGNLEKLGLFPLVWVSTEDGARLSAGAASEFTHRAILLAHEALHKGFLSLLYALSKLGAWPFDCLFVLDRISLSRADWPQTVNSLASASEVGITRLQAWPAVELKLGILLAGKESVREAEPWRKACMEKHWWHWSVWLKGSGPGGGEDREKQSPQEGQGELRVWGAHMPWTWWVGRSRFCLWPVLSRRCNCSY